jgi:hypothetical protein
MCHQCFRGMFLHTYLSKIQAESDYTCVDLNNEVQFEDVIWSLFNF